MQYMRLTIDERESLLGELEAMPGYLEGAFATLSPADTRIPGPNDTFSPVEQCWHLADLEREGYGTRIRRLLAENDPELPDFDGARVARERNYRSLSLTEGITAFRSARAANLNALRSLSVADWTRPGRQAGVGGITLCDLPAMMAEHDAGHRREIEMWVAAGKERPRRP